MNLQQPIGPEYEESPAFSTNVVADKHLKK